MAYQRFSTYRKSLSFMVILILALTACSQPTAAPTLQPLKTSTNTPVPPPPTAEPTASPIPTQENTPTSAPTPAPTATVVANQGTLVEFKGVSFRYPAGLFSAAKPQVAPQQAGDPNTPGWPGPAPEYFYFQFDGYPLSGAFHQPQIFIYPIQEYAAINPPAGEIAAKLAGELQQGAVSAKDQPFLPMWNAGQVFFARANLQAFGSGSGSSYLTCYSQAILPVDNVCLFYTYQGLTTDGKYYVAMVWPVNLPALDTPEVKGKFKQEFANSGEYAAYLKDITNLLNAANPADFKPSLNDLEALVKSLLVAPSVTLQAPPTPQYSCPGAMVVRLQPGIKARVTFTDGTPLRVRKDPGKNGLILTKMKEGTEFTIIEGPQCTDNGAWWRISNSDGSLAGWVLEGENGSYYVEPLK